VVDALSHWDEEYRGSPVRTPAQDAPVLVAALQHFGDVAGRRLVDLGCGTGEASLFCAAHGASVVSIDNSKVAIDNLRAYCVEHNVSNVTPICMDAADIAEVGSCDFIFGSLVLHHVEPFEEFALALRATLRPKGRAFFYENNARSRLLMWFRRHVVGKLWVPRHGDKEEYPLTPEEVNTLAKHFRLEVRYPELLFMRLISVYLFRGRGHRQLERLDDLLYRVPRLRRYSYRQCVLLEQRAEEAGAVTG
jgi:2-polyprenyl-3-methyl-5-hydroxy-6-metoxy-1,4-benzoquinol methylase